MGIKKSEEKCTSFLAPFTAFSCSVLLNFLAENRRRPLVWQYRRTLFLEIPRICGNFACKCCWTSLKKPPESRIFLISSFTPNEAIKLMFLHVIPPNKNPPQYTGNKFLVTCVQGRNLGTSKPQNGFFLSWSWELGCKVMTSRHVPLDRRIFDFLFLISDFWFLISYFRFPISDFWFLISVFRFPFSVF